MQFGTSVVFWRKSRDKRLPTLAISTRDSWCGFGNAAQLRDSSLSTMFRSAGKNIDAHRYISMYDCCKDCMILGICLRRSSG